MTTTRTTTAFISAWLWVSVILAATTIETEAWTSTNQNKHRELLHFRHAHSRTSTSTRPATSSVTALFGKKKKKQGAGGGSAAAKIQVKLLEHIAGTGQAGDVIMVNPVFFDNKLRPKKLARMITDEEVQADLEKKQSESDELRKQAKAMHELLDDDGNGDGDGYVLTFHDNQTGPDGKKLFGGIGTKKLMESLRKDSKEFGAYSKQFSKQVSILDIEEQDEDESSSPSSDGDGEPKSKYKDYSSYSSASDTESEDSVVTYSSLPKKDKLTIKHTGVFRMKVALTKDLFARVKIVVD